MREKRGEPSAKSAETVRSRPRLILAGVLALHLAAVGFSYGIQIVVNYPEWNSAFGLLRSYIYLFIIALWGSYIRHRITAKYTRRYLLGVVFLMILWMVFRSLKYSFASDPAIRRMLWYLYYVPMLGIPPLCIVVSSSIGRAEGVKMSSGYGAVFLISSLLILLVLTNDMHQLVFRFPEHAAFYSDEDYRHGMGYFVVAAWCAFCVAAAVISLIVRCRRKRLRSPLVLLPIAPILFCASVLVLEVLGNSFVRIFFGDITIDICLNTIAAYELCIRIRMIPSNEHYRLLFRSLKIPIFIANRQGEIRLTTRDDIALPESAAGMKLGDSEIVDRKYRLSMYPIRGGTAYWLDDIEEPLREIGELQDIQESLEHSSLLAEEQIRTNREKARLIESNRLLRQMEMKTSGHLNRMVQLAEAIKQTDDAETEREILREMAMLGAYYKRRNNLIFIEETQSRIRREELEYCIRESLTVLEWFGIREAFYLDLETLIDMKKATEIYDCLEDVLEQVFRVLDTIAVYLSQTPQEYVMVIPLELKEEIPIRLKRPCEVEQESETACTLEVRFPRGGESG